MLVVTRYIGDSITITDDNGNEIVATLSEINGFAATFVFVCSTAIGRYAFTATAYRHYSDQEKNKTISLMPTMESLPIEIILTGQMKNTFIRVGVKASREYRVMRSEVILRDEDELGKGAKKIQEQ